MGCVQRGLKVSTYFQPSCHGQGDLPVVQITPSNGAIQPGREPFWIHNFPGQPAPVPDHPHTAEMLHTCMSL